MTDIAATRLIIDCGATKAHIAAISGDSVAHYFTAGFTPLSVSEELPDDTAALVSRLRPVSVCHYGAACAGDELCGSMAALYRKACRDVAEVSVHSDMLGAARSAAGDTPAIICILGTGSNSCLYDGRVIVDNIPPLGYILGDEGSGASLGRRLVADIYKRRMPGEIAEAFERETGLTRDAVIEAVYRTPGANRRLASLTRFMAAHIGCQQVSGLIIDEFERFIDRNVLPYDGVSELPLRFIGSIAHHFADQLTAAAERHGLRIASIAADPMEGLLKYHLSH